MNDGSEAKLRLAASHNADAPPPADLEGEVTCALQDARDAESEATSAVDSAELESVTKGHERVELEGGNYRLFVLTTVRGQQLHVIGAVAAREGTEPIHPPNGRLLDAVSRALLEGLENV